MRATTFIRRAHLPSHCFPLLLSVVLEQFFSSSHNANARAKFHTIYQSVFVRFLLKTKYEKKNIESLSTLKHWNADRDCISFSCFFFVRHFCAVVIICHFEFFWVSQTTDIIRIYFANRATVSEWECGCAHCTWRYQAIISNISKY